MQQRHRRAPPHEAADQPKKKNPSIVCSSWLGKSAPKARSFPPNVSPAAPTDIRKLRPLVSLPRAGGGGNCCCCTAPLALWACGSADARVTRAHHCGGIGLGHLPHDRDTHHAGRMITTSMYKYIYILLIGDGIRQPCMVTGMHPCIFSHRWSPRPPPLMVSTLEAARWCCGRAFGFRCRCRLLTGSAVAARASTL